MLAGVSHEANAEMTGRKADSAFTRTVCWAWGQRRCCTAASPRPIASAPIAAGSRTATAKPEDAPAGAGAPGLRPRRPAPTPWRWKNPPGRLKRREPRGDLWSPLRLPCLPTLCYVVLEITGCKESWASSPIGFIKLKLPVGHFKIKQTTWQTCTQLRCYLQWLQY